MIWMFLFSFKVNKFKQWFFFYCILNRYIFVAPTTGSYTGLRSMSTEQRWNNRLWELWGEKLCDTFASRVYIKCPREQGRKRKWQWLGRRQKKESERSRGNERRWRQDATPLCAPLKVSAHSFYRSQSSFLPEPQSSQPSSHGVHITCSWTFLQPESANDWASCRGMQGWVCGTEQEGTCITTSPTSK